MRPSAALLLVPVLAAAACRKEAPPAAAKPGTESTAPAATPGEPAKSPGSAAETIERVFAAVRDADREKLLQNWSTGLLAEELEKRGVLASSNAATKAALDEHFDLLSSYLTQSLGEVHTVVTTTGLPENTVLIQQRTRQEDGARDTVVRYWLREQNGRWQVVDCEDLSLGYRASTLVLGLVTPADRPWRQPLLDLMAKIGREDRGSTFPLAVTVADEVDALLAADPPDDLKAFALKWKAERLIMRRKHADALKVIKEFSQMEPKSPWADYLRGLALMNLHRGFEAITAFRRYGDSAGWDATTHEYVGWCHFSQGDEKSALEHAKKGLELNKDAYGCLVTAVLSSKPNEIAGLSGYFKNTFDSENTFEYVLDEVIDMEDRKVAKAVFELLEKELPDSKLIATYRKKLETSTE